MNVHLASYTDHIPLTAYTKSQQAYNSLKKIIRKFFNFFLHGTTSNSILSSLELFQSKKKIEK